MHYRYYPSLSLARALRCARTHEAFFLTTSNNTNYIAHYQRLRLTTKSTDVVTPLTTSPEILCFCC